MEEIEKCPIEDTCGKNNQPLFDYLEKVEGKIAGLEMKPNPENQHSYEAYMDGTDFFFEEGRPFDGNRFFYNIENLKKQKMCIEECGIVKVRVSFIEWIQLPEDDNRKKDQS